MPDAWFGVTGTLEGEKSHDRIAVLQDGRVVAMGKYYLQQADFFSSNGHAAGCEAINVRVPDLRMIEYVLNIQFFYENANICAEPIYEAVNKKIVGNVVGMTLLGAANAGGGTLHVEVIAIGPP